MAHPRTFRFGVQFIGAGSGDEWRYKVRKAESLGYSSVCLSDHFQDQLAPVPGLMAAAEATRNIRINACVFDNDFRHPVVLAKEAATLDLLSGGRFELGIGAGWMKTDYDQSGIPYESAAVRIDKLEESLQILKGLFRDGTYRFEGKHYQVNLDGRPKPVQRPHPPFFIGGGGKRMLGVAARHGDIVGINFDLRAGKYGPELGGQATIEATEQKIQWVKEAAGARFADIELQVLVFVPIVSSTRDLTAHQVAPHFGTTPDVILKMPYALIGTVDEIAAVLEERREKYGFSYIVIGEQGMETFAPVVARLAGK